jgi:hypothetical protein
MTEEHHVLKKEKLSVRDLKKTDQFINYITEIPNGYK